MQNFVFHNPTKILFGKGTVPSIGEETLLFGKKVLLVYGTGSIKTNGLYEQIIQSLTTAGASITEHGGVQSNPLLSHVHQGIQLAKDNSCEVVCAVGGGSVIDAAKAISQEPRFSMMCGNFSPVKKVLRHPFPSPQYSPLLHPALK